MVECPRVMVLVAVMAQHHGSAATCAAPGTGQPPTFISAARWVVLLPGAAQQSTTTQPGCGASACAGMQLDLLCSTSLPSATIGWSCSGVPAGSSSRSGSSLSLLHWAAWGGGVQQGACQGMDGPGWCRHSLHDVALHGCASASR